MTEQEFLKKRFKPFEIIEYQHSYVNEKNEIIIDCILIGVNFEERLFHLAPIPKDYYEKESFWVRCEHCQRPIPKLKVVK